MTWEVLERGNALAADIRNVRGKKGKLEEVLEKCRRIFQAAKGNSAMIGVFDEDRFETLETSISLETAMKALEMELMDTERKLYILEEEFAGLH